jgi:hypothetical protein
MYINVYDYILVILLLMFELDLLYYSLESLFHSFFLYLFELLFSTTKDTIMEQE